MTEPSPAPATPRSTLRTVLAVLALAWDIAVTTTVIVDLILSGWRIAPSPLWSFAITVGAILTVSSVMVEVGTRAVQARHRDVDRIIARIELLEQRSARRYAVLNGGHVEAAGSAPVGYPEGYADGLARRPAMPSQRHLNSVDS